MSSGVWSSDVPSARSEIAHGCRFQDFVDAGYGLGVHMFRVTS